jgi:exostosin family protein
MRVIVLSLLMDQWLLMVSRTFAMRGHEVLIVTNPEPCLGDSDHEDTLVRFRGFPNTRMLPIDTTIPDPCDLLICGFKTSWTHRIKIAYMGWLRAAARVSLVYRNAHHCWLRRVFAEFKALAECPLLLKTSTFATEDFPPGSSLFRLKARGSYFGPIPRQKALCDPATLERLLSPYNVSSERAYLASFMGSRNPVWRAEIVDLLEQRFSKDRDLRVAKECRDRLNGRLDLPTVFWHVSTPGNPARIPFGTYAQILDESYFCLCLPGFTGTCSRTIEAIYRGAIPAVSSTEKDRYDIPLIDNANSILVRNNGWDEAFRRIRTMDPIQISRMRERLENDSRIWLEWSKLEQRLIDKLYV